jgi:hypothetical protein
MGIQERLERKFFVSYINPNKKIVPTSRWKPNACITAEIQTALHVLLVHGVFGYCNFMSSYSGNETLFVR